MLVRVRPASGPGAGDAPPIIKDRRAGRAGGLGGVLLAREGGGSAGLAAGAPAGGLGLRPALGGGFVEGYPENADSVPAGFLYNGALSTYEKLGFTRNRKIGKHRWVVTRVVKPGPA